MFLIFWVTDVRLQIWMLSVLPKSIKKKLAFKEKPQLTWL